MKPAHVSAAMADLWPEYPWSKLSKREGEVAVLLVNGRSHEEVASALGITLKTVEAHIAEIRREVGMSKDRRPLTSVLLADVVRHRVALYEALP